MSISIFVVALKCVLLFIFKSRKNDGGKKSEIENAGKTTGRPTQSRHVRVTKQN